MSDTSPIRVTLHPAIPAFAEDPETFKAIRRDLEETGFRPSIGEPCPPTGGDVATLPMELIVRVAETLGDEAVSAIVGVVLERLVRTVKRRRRERTQVVIYGPDGEVLKRLEVPRSPD